MTHRCSQLKLVLHVYISRKMSSCDVSESHTTLLSNEARVWSITQKVNDIMKPRRSIVRPKVTTEVRKHKHNKESSENRLNSNINIDGQAVAKDHPPNLLTTERSAA